MYYRASNKDPISLLHKIAVGGEGAIWQTQIPGVLAKIFHKPHDLIFRKLRLMIDRPPLNAQETQNHLPIAWPQDILLGEEYQPVGFLMPRVPGALSLSHVYNTKLRKKNAAGFNWYYLHATAYNLAIILRSLHEKNYIVGDLKTDNFLVTDKALVSVIDTDSFQIQNDVENFYCEVGSEGFTPPELIGCDLKTIERTEIQDRFGLAIIIHLLIMGFHPFSGNKIAEEKTLDILVNEGMDNLKKTPEDQFYIAYQDIHPRLYEAFHKAFIAGHNNPDSRPSAAEWVELLEEAMPHLSPCSENLNHFFDDHHPECTWCFKERQFNFSVFPGGAVQEKVALLQKFKRTLKENDYRSILQLWTQYSFLQEEFLGSEEEQQRIKKVLAYTEALEQFKKFCTESVSGEDILNFWEQDKRLSFYTPKEDEQIKGQSLQDFLHHVKNEVQSISDLKRAIDIADSFVQAHQAHDEYLEREILDKAENMPSSSLSLFQTRLQKAKQIVSLFKQLAILVRDQDFLGAHVLLSHQEFSVDKLNLPNTFKDFLATYWIYKDIVKQFQRLIEDNAPEEKILKLWDAHGDFQGTNLAHFAIEEGITLKHIIERLQERGHLLDVLTQLLEQQEFIKLSKAWNSELCTGEEFKKFLPFVSEGNSLQKNWHRIKRALLESEPEQVVPYWKELYAPLVKAEGLTPHVRSCFTTYFQETAFPSLPQSRILQENQKLIVHWPWPIGRHTIPLCWVTVREDRFPLHPNDVEKLHHSLTFSHKGPEGSATLLWDKETAYIAIWPCIQVGDDPIILGHPLQIENKRPPLIQYSLQGKRRWGHYFIDLQILASENIDLHDLEIVAAENRPPLSFETSVPLATIPLLSVPQGKKISTRLAANAWSKESVFRLYPHNRKILDAYKFQCVD